ncbi:hypothetical protein HAX54_037883 [Datura stramonium]|uniref:Fe2OG dioxygenase domain-containing protein n=1 Tax=Datura stramonium TaxID=4076 RepID=A0ABS8VLB8_DATST|nr:hypothetical protein [Datura stramonium]
MEAHTGELEVNYKKVPSVQEMAKKKLVTIPSRYVRDDQDRSIASSNNIQVPVVDMQRLINASDHDSIDLELQKLHFAAKEWGFFQIEVCIKLVVIVELENSNLIFGETIEEYSEEVKELSMKVLKELGKAVGIEEEEVKSVFEEGMQSMRMNYYPPCPQPELVMGVCPHSDACALTILLQVNQTEGLQIRKDRFGFPFYLPNAFIVNVGDAFEIFTNGIYKSIEHRSVVSSEKERISVATFQSARLDGELGPANSLISAFNPPLFKKMGVTEYFRGYFTRELVGKSHVDTMRITTTEDDLKNVN